MLVCTTWKSRPLSPDQTNRMMATWAKIEAKTAESPDLERLCWYINVDGSGGLTVARSTDTAAGNAFALEVSLALSEFLEMDSKTVLDLDGAMPAILAAVEQINA